MNKNVKKYNNIKLIITISKGIIAFILLLLFIKSKYNIYLENFLRGYINNDYIVLLAFTFVVSFASTIIFFPLNFYSEYILEHYYNLSNQTLKQWFWENVKEGLITLLISIPILIIFYFVLTTFHSLWWLPFGAIMFLFSVLLSQVFPILIFPLFYKVQPIENEELKMRIINLCKANNLNIENVFRFNMSKNTKKGNAAFAGLGKTKRILLGDTILDNYSIDEIETVIAHELGHYKKKHIVKNIIINTILSFLTFCLIAKLYEISIKWFGVNSIVQISALPILLLWASIIGLILTPLSNYISRKYEYEADEFSVRFIKKKDIFIKTLEKLTEQNFGNKEPHPLVEWFFYSHPSIKKRISAIEKLSDNL